MPKWFARFKSGDFGLQDEERPGQPKKFEDEELEALLDEDCCQTQEELAESLEVTQAAISKRLKAAGYIQKQGNLARPHVTIPVKNYLGNSGWEVLPHPHYSPDLAPSDYHLFQSMQNAFTGIR